MQWMADHERDAIMADFVLTENGGLHSGPREQPYVGINVGEKGVAWRRLRVRGTPGHGSTPFKADNALMTAAAVMQRIGDYQPGAAVPRAVAHHGSRRWASTTRRSAALLDPDQIDAFLDALPVPGPARTCTRARTPRSRATRSARRLGGDGDPTRMKTNVIPDCVDIGVDVRTLPGEGHDDVDAHLRAALGDLYDRVEVEVIMNDPATISRTDTPLWDALERSIAKPFPDRAPDAAADRRVHRLAHLPRAGRRVVRRRPVQPRPRPGRLRTPIPRQRRAHRRRVACA